MSTDYNLLQRKARDWALKVVELHNMRVPPALTGRKNTLISAAKTIKNAIEKVAGAQEYLSPLNQLGVIPLVIGGAGIAWAIAAVVKWTTDYSKFKTEVLQFNKVYTDAVNAGMSPSQATNVATSQTKKELSWKAIAAIGIPTLLIGGISLWYLTRNRGQ